MANPYQFSQPPAPRGLSLSSRKPTAAEIIQKQMGSQVAELGGRIKILEERIDTLRTHIELVDGSVVEKHKATIKELGEIKNSLRSLRADVDEVKDFSERIAKRMEAFASKEQVKVLERYIDAWQPLNYITRSELKATVKSILKDIGFKIKEK